MKPDYTEMDRTERRQARRERADRLYKLGEQILALPQEERILLPLETQLQDAMQKVVGMRLDSGRRRQLRYIAKLLRETDTEALEQLMEERAQRVKAGRTAFQALEAWRDRLIQEGDEAVEQFIEAHGGDRKKLRQLWRRARKEQEQELPPKSSRALFRALRESLQG